jgi:tetratricopeptide (TPR) repeat protein
MKKLILLLAFVIFANLSHSQKLKTYYIKRDGEKTSKLYANFKRTVENQDEIWKVKDYYLNDSIHMIGHFIDKGLTLKSDIFTYYHPNGNLSRMVAYKNDAKHGEEKLYYITGTLSQSGNYNMGEVTGKWIWYSEDGSIENQLDNVNPNNLSENYAPAGYVGGNKNLYEYLKKADYSMQKGVTAIYDRTFTTFQINEEGNVTDVDIIVHGSKAMDSAIIKHLYNMPKWRAAKKNGKYVTSNHVLPIRFSKKSEKILSDKILGEAFFNSSVDDYKAENYEKAIFKLIQAISRDHMEAKYYYLLGNCYFILKNQDFACADWTIANSLDNDILKKEFKDLCDLN